jgi:type IV secretion system protein VirB10
MKINETTDDEVKGSDEHKVDTSSKMKFDHLKKSSKVVPSSNGKNIIGVIVGVVVLILIIVLMFSSGGHQQTKPKNINAASDGNNYVLQDNERKLAELQKNQESMPVTFNSGTPALFPKYSDNQDSKAMKVRRNAPTQMYSASPPAGDSSDSTSTGVSATLSGKGDFASFANEQSNTVSTVTATKIKHPGATIAEGEFIHASLETAIDSDLPGMLRAVITEPVYAYTGESPIIPRGSRLVGQYSALSSNGSAAARVFVIWNRIITPSGISIMINSPGSDQLGQSGMGADATDHHFFKIFGTATLLSIMGASTASSGVSGEDQPNSANMYRQAIGSAFQQAAQNSLNQNMSIKPTLHIHQGDSVTVFVAHDLNLYNVLGQNL